MTKKILFLLSLAVLPASFAEVPTPLPFNEFVADHTNEVVSKSMTVAIEEEGYYCISATIHAPTNLFCAARLEVFRTLILAQSPLVRMESPLQKIEVVFHKDKPGKQSFVVRMMSYTAGQDMAWKELKLERIADRKKEVELFKLWSSFRGETPQDDKLEAWEMEAFNYPSIKLPPSPTHPQAIIMGRPTLKSIGFRWPIKADYNRNGTVKVAYRQKGDTTWLPAQGMLRMMFEETGFSRLSWAYTCPNQYAGSILNLKPGTTYEIKLTLVDPDGGNKEETVSATTRAELEPCPEGNTIDVYPGSLQRAYAEANPGDTLLLHPGTYSFESKHNEHRYSGSRKYIFPPVHEELSTVYSKFSNAVEDSAVRFNKSATLERPITIRGIDNKSVIIDGGTSAVLFNFTDARYHCFENMTLQNAEFIYFSNNAKGITIRDCVIRDCRYGIVAGSGDLEKLYTQSLESTNKVYDVDISNNTITGNWPEKEWADGWGVYVKQIGYEKLRLNTGIMLGGQGHAVHHNRISQFWDGFVTYFIISPQIEAPYQNADIDIYNNDIFCCPDDCIEADFIVNNIRVFKNLASNSHMGISFQPVFGGPAYIYKNVVFNSKMFAFKFSRNPAGVLVFNNTCIAARGGRFSPEWQNSQLVNNLFIGNADVETGPLWTGVSTPQTSVLDYNGYNETGSGKVFLAYALPENPIMAKGYHIFENMEELGGNGVWEKNGLFNIQTNEFKHCVQPGLQYADGALLDVRPTAAASFIDAGKVLFNINDSYQGGGPAIGAFDENEKKHHYGPVE